MHRPIKHGNKSYSTNEVHLSLLNKPFSHNLIIALLKSSLTTSKTLLMPCPFVSTKTTVVVCKIATLLSAGFYCSPFQHCNYCHFLLQNCHNMNRALKVISSPYPACQIRATEIASSLYTVYNRTAEPH